MDFNQLRLIVPVLLLLDQSHAVICSRPKGPSFYDNYKISYGYDHAWSKSQGRDVQISLDQSSGAAFQSKQTYGSGFFHLNMKLPGSNSGGVVTAFYLSSVSPNHHDELDFEFLGNNDGKPIYLQTNVIANGKGDREQRIRLWFDPTSKYHSYRILWNRFQIVFYIDNYPIRVFKNKRKLGVGFPSQPLQIESSIWNGDNWATDGGLTKINWTYAPFIAGFRSFGINGCPAYGSNMKHCYSIKFWWNRQQYWQLNPSQQRTYQTIKSKYTTYDYCTDGKRFPTPPPECPQ
ncbi:Xyloglucan endotransglucosylase/hydrolase protein 2 precursor, putative [Ricinus communis]|uniref:Xyloglucan endotransglucosylase/hydrolase n=1 Tax=Ricinus communis TaxID=3988 RepID=B9RWF7_RICCO|nr:Xyloglucan endotransglucosylase/hydrolase protein 2 precursor, putative [Ricinus communis]|eukprot:XP_002518076.1 xyloglucan endotransglucosylase/hydrolase protein 3 [Ricinus communis]